MATFFLDLKRILVQILFNRQLIQNYDCAFVLTILIQIIPLSFFSYPVLYYF